jgi:arginine decarboxylase
VDIIITTGTAQGPTALAAFDAALLRAGVANYNLIPLSSVIPPMTVLKRTLFVTPPHEYGHRLYVVMARGEADEIGQQAWAGLGWTQEGESGRGLFVEFTGSNKIEVQQAIACTLESMKAGRPYCYGANESEIVGITCTGDPVCALVIAVYQSKDWSD